MTFEQKFALLHAVMIVLFVLLFAGVFAVVYASDVLVARIRTRMAKMDRNIAEWWHDGMPK